MIICLCMWNIDSCRVTSTGRNTVRALCHFRAIPINVTQMVAPASEYGIVLIHLHVISFRQLQACPSWDTQTARYIPPYDVNSSGNSFLGVYHMDIFSHQSRIFFCFQEANLWSVLNHSCINKHNHPHPRQQSRCATMAAWIPSRHWIVVRRVVAFWRLMLWTASRS